MKRILTFAILALSIADLAQRDYQAPRLNISNQVNDRIFHWDGYAFLSIKKYEDAINIAISGLKKFPRLILVKSLWMIVP